MKTLITLIGILAAVVAEAAKGHDSFVVVGDGAMRPLRYEGMRSEAALGSWIDETDDYYVNWDVHILNYSAKGQTTETFVAGDRAHEFMKEIRPGDGVLIALEAKTADALRRLVKGAKEKGGEVVLANTLGSPDSGFARAVAGEEKVAFVDVRKLAGVGAAETVMDVPLAEARRIAGLFVAEARRQGLRFAKHYVSGKPAKVPRRRWDRRQRIEQRIAMMGPVARGAFVVRPTYTSVGFRLGAKPGMGALEAHFRKVGEDVWRKARHSPPYFEDAEEYRGSIMGLQEDTEYELKVGDATTTVRTWRTDVPVARMVVLDETTRFPLVISDKGTEGGWIRYTAKPGVVLRRDRKGSFIKVKDASCVLIEGIHFAGGGGQGCEPLRIENSGHVRVRNCEFTGWGVGGEADFTRRGQPVADGKIVNFDAALMIGRGAKCTTVERCYFHDAYGKSNSWKYSHPAGNEAIMMCRPEHSTVLRWNDMVGSDLHRFNDAVEGEANFWENGGFNCDADIDGNFLIFCNDDDIELDGGQCNVRCFRNRFESAYCGVSIQGCMVSPVYVCDNEFAGLCDEFGGAGQQIKTWGFDIYGRSPVAYIFDNVFNGQGIRPQASFIAPRGIVENNRDNPASHRSAPRVEYPVRPLPFLLDVARIDGVEVRKGVANPANVAFKARWTGAKDGERVKFTVRKNDDADWFDVHPATGSIGPGETVDFTLAFKPERMNNRRFYRGAFLVRDEKGLSRVCSVYAATDFAPPFRAEKDGEFAQYIDAFRPASGKPDVVEDPRGQGGKAILLESGKSSKSKDDKDAEPLTYAFEVLKRGRYYFHIHGASTPPTEDLWADGGKAILSVSVDGAPMRDSEHGAKSWMGWTIIAPGNRWGNSIGFFDLEPGRYTISIGAKTKKWAPFYFDGIVLTDSPESFEIR